MYKPCTAYHYLLRAFCISKGRIAPRPRQVSSVRTVFRLVLLPYLQPAVISRLCTYIKKKKLLCSVPVPHVPYQHYIKAPRVKLLQIRRKLVESAGDVSAGGISSGKSSTLINPAHQLNPAVRPAAGTGRVLIDSGHSSQSFKRGESERERESGGELTVSPGRFSHSRQHITASHHGCRGGLEIKDLYIRGVRNRIFIPAGCG